jgi:hypothetical protein
MAIQSNHHDHWIYGTQEQRVLMLAIVAAIFLAFVFEHLWR